MRNNLFFLPALIAGFGLILAGRVMAQTFTTLYGFTATSSSANSDGANPYAGLILSGSTLYGTAQNGGSSGNGTVFAVNTNGTGFTNLYSFTATDSNTGTNTDGANPSAGLILSGNTLYGTTQNGGSSGNGTVFAINTSGTGFTNLYSFTASDSNAGTNTDGANPSAGLILSGSTLYGTAQNGGSSGNGTVFAININGTGFTTLYSFTAPDLNTSTNTDGANPSAGLILSGSTLYGTAQYGGSSGNGTVFKVNTGGTGFTNLYSFSAPDPNTSTNSDGANPYAGLILSGSTLYGTSQNGGDGGSGTVFAVNTNGTGFTNLHSFLALDPDTGTNSDGANPSAGLILSGNTLFGTAQNGGSSGNGTVFKVNTGGTRFTALYSFSAPDLSTSTNNDGANPFAGLILLGSTLFGTAQNGGSSGNGTVFALNTNSSGFTTLYSFSSGDNGANPYAGLVLSGGTLYGTAEQGGSGSGTVYSLSPGSVIAPRLTIVPSGASVILTWPTNAVGFTLQSATNPVPPAVWTPVSPGPVIVNGQNTVTDPISDTQKFYRLSQ